MGGSTTREMESFDPLRVRGAGSTEGGTLLPFPLDLAHIGRLEQAIRGRLAVAV